MQLRNPYYRDLITGSVLRTAVLNPLPQGAFHDAMARRGKLGGQNKVPRLANDRAMANNFSDMIERTHIVGVVGGSASGKGTVVSRLLDHYGDRAAVLRMDDYYRPIGEVPRMRTASPTSMCRAPWRWIGWRRTSTS